MLSTYFFVIVSSLAVMPFFFRDSSLVQLLLDPYYRTLVYTAKIHYCSTFMCFPIKKGAKIKVLKNQSDLIFATERLLPFDRKGVAFLRPFFCFGILQHDETLVCIFLLEKHSSVKKKSILGNSGAAEVLD